jgi:hypothetical protein
MAVDATPLDVQSNWLLLERLWNRTVRNESAMGARSGGWAVQKEYSGEGVAPIAGDPDEIAVYVERGYRKIEVGRWPLEAVAEYDTDDAADDNS